MNSPSVRRLAALYVAGVVLPGFAVVVVLTLLPPGTSAAIVPVPDVARPLRVGHALASVAAFVVTAHLGGLAARKLRQPRVIGQAAVGVILGPSALGHAAPALGAWLHDGGSDQAIDLLSQLGVILFVFLVARELSDGEHRVGRAATAVGQTMVAVPLLGGVLTAVVFLAGQRPGTVAPVPYTLFVGLAMSATALPVLAHILAERQMLTSPVGTVGTAAAAVGDAGIWCLLAVTLCLAEGGPLAATGVRLAAGVGFAAVVWWLARPILRRVLPAERDSRYAGPGLLLAGLLLCAVTTDYLGLHALFGAFLFGLAMPRASMLVQRLTVAVDGFTQWLLLPLFFTAVGARTRLDLIVNAPALATCGLVMAVAVLTKVISAGGAGRMIGLSWRDSAALGTMMNCRGLTELLLLNIGLSAGLISARTFTVFVVMALMTTAATGPLLSRFGVRAQPGPLPKAALMPTSGAQL